MDAKPTGTSIIPAGHDLMITQVTEQGSPLIIGDISKPEKLVESPKGVGK